MIGLDNDTAGRDLKALTERGLIEAQGNGCAMRCVMKTTGRFLKSTDAVRSAAIARRRAWNFVSAHMNAILSTVQRTRSRS